MKNFESIVFFCFIIFAYAAVEAVVVDEEVGATLLYANQDIRDFYDQSRETEKILEHIRSFATADSESMSDQYLPRIGTVHLGPSPTFGPLNVLIATGTEQIVGTFAFVLSEAGGFPAGTVLTITSVSKSLDIIYETFNTTNSIMDCVGTDAYTVSGNRIFTQTAFLSCA